MDHEEEILQAIHSVQLEMMDDLLGLLEKYDIRYILAYGTFLGAVRHKGFIPWDDDVDIQLPHKEYLRFAKIVKKAVDQEKYCIQNSERLQGYRLYTKIRLRGTYLPTPHGNNNPDEEGIWLDFFDVIDAARNEKMLQLQVALIWSIQKTKWLYTKAKDSRKMREILKKAYNLCLFCLIKLMYGLVVALGHVAKPKECINMGIGFLHKPDVARLRKSGVIFPRSVLDERKKYMFENREFYGPADYDTYLKAFYSSDYMTPKRTHIHAADYSKVIAGDTVSS